MLDLLEESNDAERRKEIAEYINTHPDEYSELLDSLFIADSEKHEYKVRLLTLTDLLSKKLGILLVEKAIADNDPDIRIKGLQAAYRTRVDSLNSTIVDLLKDGEQPFLVRKWAVHILASTDPKYYGRLIRQLTRDSNEELDLRKEAVYALTNVADDETIGTLCALLGDQLTQMRQSGAWALSSIGSPDSISCLLAALEDQDEGVRDWAIRALRDMDDSRALQGLADAMATGPPSEQVRMIQLLVEKRSEILLRAIAELLSSPNVDVRRTASWAMGVSPYPPAVERLEKLIDDPDQQVQDYARKALARLGRVSPGDFGLFLG